ncbi:MAG: Crp/Fnr family transcriptional regulator [Spirochaetia bacterium]|nr:Crp/Fnr family transcriptional regulator [Spirochaetia bacterium]
MQANQYRILAELSLFTSFSPMDLEGLFSRQSYSIRNYVKNQMIYLSGDSCTSLDILLEGSVSLQSLDEEGSLFKAQVLEKGAIYGATLLFGSSNKFPMTVVSEGNAEVLHLSKALVLDLCKENSRFTEILLQLVSDKAHALSTALTNLTSRTLKENLLMYLKDEVVSQGSQTITLRITKKELAHRLGVERTSLSRTLALLRDEKILTFDRGRITLLDS